ncbi:uncharacterized protein FIESC28_00150 [Fusarium coffeatum]|uniref:Uncharacterized protein n=1 Tax=Fusarium coffeatum TaxID=231269 RepID=A0A366SDU0_9HYPO|nr:uncharacterized protein FIESC28_00150 [Fusarium coffeatum]RBR27078.1 hypothetical protein FIESC28_00150 [Fusarium coffeatum]
MFASIKVNVINNDHSNNFEIVEQACSPQGNGSQWNNKGGKLTLSMGDNQGSGMLRFKTEQNKEAFFIAMGVEAPRPWVDIVTGLGDDYTCVQALPDYYDYKSERSRMRGDRQVHQIENIDRRLIRAEFKYSEGPNYELDIIINEKGSFVYSED